MKKVVSVLLVVVIVFSLMAGMGISSNAGTNGHSQSDALAWLNSKIGIQIGNGQCPALAREYYSYLGYSVRGNGKDYENNVPSGWQRIYYYSGFVPQAGDVAVWRATNTQLGKIYGHVAIVKSGTSSNMICYEQGNSAGNKVRTNRYSYGSVTCFIRPDFSSGRAPQFAYISTDKLNYKIDEIVTFSFNTDITSNTNTLWVYCPNGETLYYQNLGKSTTLAFGMAGYYEGLVEAWNGVGSCKSSRISWYVGKPQYAYISINKSSYSVEENIIFSFNTAAKAGQNTLWIYYPDGTSKYYQNCGTSKTLSFTQTGTYKALVEAWNDIGSCISSKVSFTITNKDCTHSYSSKVTTAATCTATGVKTFTCSKCGNQYTQSIVALGHDYSSTVTKAATCTEKGVKTFNCSRCTSSYTQDISATGHSFVSNKEYCQNGCGTKNPNYVAPHTHSWGSGKITKAATCTSNGVRTYTCSCGETKTESIPAKGHSFVSNHEYCQNGCGTKNPDYVAKHIHHYQETIIYPDSTHLGYTEHICSCGNYFFDTYTAPTGKLTLKHSARTANAIKVQWNAVRTATGYQVQISTKDGKKWSTYSNLKAGVTNYTFKNLSAGNNYKFRVRFYITAAGGKSYFSPWSTTLNSPTLPTGTTVTKLTPAKKAFTAQWKKNATVNGYQIQYSLKSNFSGAKTITVKSPKTLKAVAKKLYVGKYYYVRIRTYKTISNVNYYSAWSKTYKVKTK